MLVMTEENIKAELSYAYLHAIASRAGFSCAISNRHGDNAGIDAVISAYGQLAPDSTLTDFSLEVQLKATAKPRRTTKQRPDRFSHVLEVPHYDKLRKTTTEAQRIMVVLYLPKQDHLWLNHSEYALVARRCAYWVSLRGAAASSNNSNQTVYVPTMNVFSVTALRTLMTRLSREERIDYAG